ncbi:MAG: VWA domain-containing protein [Oligoflexia bacterium]|nr:VWA domain-containing protein [Oligoflexia bacterium]
MQQLLLAWTGISFVYPLALLFPPLFLLVRPLRSAIVPYPVYPRAALLKRAPAGLRVWLRRYLLPPLLLAALLLISLAAARPQRISFLNNSGEARNLVLALDLSRSMSAQDFYQQGRNISRLDAVKLVVSEFLRERPGDRIGIVVFGSTSLLLSPLTLDHELLTQLVARLDVGMAQDGTAIGDGLGLSVKRLASAPDGSRAVVLVTDGANNSGQVDPEKAAHVAKDLGIKIHTVGIGSDKPVVINSPSNFIFGGGLRQVEFDEKTLQEIAKISGGIYFHAENLEGLRGIYQELDKLESSTAEDAPPQKIDELFPPLLAWALALYLAALILSRGLLATIP